MKVNMVLANPGFTKANPCSHDERLPIPAEWVGGLKCIFLQPIFQQVFDIPNIDMFYKQPSTNL